MKKVLNKYFILDDYSNPIYFKTKLEAQNYRSKQYHKTGFWSQIYEQKTGNNVKPLYPDVGIKNKG